MTSRGVSRAFQKGVPLLPRLLHPGSRGRDDDIVVTQGSERPGEHIRELVFVLVAMQGRSQCARRHRVVNDREPLTVFAAVQLSDHLEASEIEPDVATASHV
jgi:hypothetical protein